MPRRAPVIASRAGDVEVDAVYPVRELTLAWRGGGVEERLDFRFVLCYPTRPICDSDPAHEKTSNHGDATMIARVPQSPIIGVCFVVQKELHGLDFSGVAGDLQRREVTVPSPPPSFMFAPCSNNSRAASR